jgi:hypothetical protein
MAPYPYPSESEFWTWYTSEVAHRYAAAGRTFPDDAEAFRWFSRCGHNTAHMLPDAAARKTLAELDAALGLVTPPIEPPIGDRAMRPVSGYVRTQNRQWADDSGLRRFAVCSWFPALRCYRDYPDAARRQLDDIAAHWHGVRIFWHVWTARWGNPTYSVDPRWPDFDDVFIRFLRECAARDLRVSLSCGDMQDLCPDGDEGHWHAHIAALAASVNDQTVSWWGIWNEGWQNSWHGFNDSDRGYAYGQRMSRSVQSIYPWGAHAITDTNEEAPNLDQWSRSPANHVMIHGLREFPDCVRRPFNTRFEGHGWLVNQDEPNGDGPDVYVGESDPRRLLAQYTMHTLMGFTTTFFGGHALRSWTPDRGLDRDWGFRQIPHLWRQMDIPENISQWEPVPGHYGNAAIYPESFADRGSGPHRCDGTQSNIRAFFIVYGGLDTWRMRTRWDGTARVWTPEGVILERPVSAGERFFQMPASQQAAIIELNRR